MKPNPSLLSLLVSLGLSVSLLAGNSSVIRSPLVNTGVDADAAGSILSSLGTSKSRVEVELSKLTPAAAYSLKVGELTEAQFTADSKGRARLRFATPAEKQRLTLDFDPRGKTVAVLDANAATVLQAIVSAQGEPPASASDERANLTAQDGVKGRAAARFTQKKDGSREFEVTVSDTTGTVLHLFVSGIARGDIAINRGQGRARFAAPTRDGRLPLEFDPRSAQIDLFDGNNALAFTGKLEAKAKGVNFDRRTTRSVTIPPTADAPQGSHAEAKLRIQADATRNLSVEVEDVPAGDYELVVNDVVQGTITVAAVAAGGTKGEIEFTTDQNDHRELPLNFDPTGATLAIRQNGTVLFTGIFKPSAGTTAPPPVLGTASQLTEALASTGLDPDATGSASFSTAVNGEMEFEVEIEDVDAGKYQLFIGGTLRGNINAVADSNARVRGKLKFKKNGVGEDRTTARAGADDAPGDDSRSGGSGGNGGGSTGANTPQLPLNFDPRGQLIEIKTAAGTFFSHVFGDGSAPATGGTGMTVVPGKVEIALISSGADPDGTARAEWKRDDRGRESFEVEIEDLAAGSYDLLVAGVVKGSITVSATDRGTRGQIEFEDEPEGGRPALDFDPLGKVITIQANGTVYFERTFPSGT